MRTDASLSHSASPSPLSSPLHKPASNVIGYIHSVETCGTVDGPGIRYVLFLSGCPLRCLYCHNCDTWDRQAGEPKTVEDVMADIERYKNYFHFSGGGVTLSGGEPTVQTPFVKALFHQCRIEGIHTCLDTSGYCEIEKAEQFLPETDLVLLDIKHMDPRQHRRLTGVDNDKILAFAKYLSQQHTPVWIRHVIVPGYTDDTQSITELCAFLASLQNINRLTFLPYHTMGSVKRAELGISDPLVGVKPPEPTVMEAARAIATQFGLPVD
ncbi:pyruvate formate lyase-activating protein [Heliobacillus mobilis]|uniref:Pyruvate formate-lyase-activating enzyme n=1 Tax=Heliobacterium mobile TaxID=28064 RepID=A0A6I3SJ06_HELMO|nr:pyruvate formate-lyase-activating protein [Heliobacterium mobile]MTV48742.1 pyruvate formate lyase-activating protein [Heliobacterium mobile]